MCTADLLLFFLVQLLALPIWSHTIDAGKTWLFAASSSTTLLNSTWLVLKPNHYSAFYSWDHTSHTVPEWDPFKGVAMAGRGGLHPGRKHFRCTKLWNELKINRKGMNKWRPITACCVWSSYVSDSIAL